MNTVPVHPHKVTSLSSTVVIIKIIKLAKKSVLQKVKSMMLIKDLGSLGMKKSHDTMNLNEISWSKLFLICEEEGGLDDKTTQNILNHK